MTSKVLSQFDLTRRPSIVSGHPDFNGANLGRSRQNANHPITYGKANKLLKVPERQMTTYSKAVLAKTVEQYKEPA